jgi:hypothetical protein
MSPAPAFSVKVRPIPDSTNIQGDNMKILQNTTTWGVAALVLLMAATRYNHFGSSLALPDASYAVFFLAGLFLGRVRGGLAILALLLVEAALVDYYAINFQGISSWCVTSAYGFLMVAMPHCGRSAAGMRRAMT